MKKRALELSGKAAVQKGSREVGRGQTKENHAWFVIRGIPLAILEPLSPALTASSSSLLLASSISPISPGPETPCFFTGLWDFFHADRRVVHQRGLTVNLLFSLFLRYARTLVRVPPRKQKKEREKEQAGKRGETIKKSKCQPP